MLVGALLAVVHLSSQTVQPSLVLLSKDGRRVLQTTVLNGQDFVALDDLATVFQLVIREDSSGAITVLYKGKTIVLTPDQPLASVSGRLVSLPAPPARSPAPARRWLVPVEFVSRALALIYDSRLDLRKSSRLLTVGDVRVPRVQLRYEPVGGGGRLTIDATPGATSSISQDNDRLTIRFDADALDVAVLPPSPQGLVQSVRLSDVVTLTVELGPQFGGFKAATQPIDNTMRLAIDLLPKASEGSSTAAPPPSPTPDLSALSGQAPSIRTIALDPGHGGDDAGAIGAGGVKEKDVALAVARRLKASIEARLGIRVLLTRDGDRTVPIDERTAMANNNKADLFISLHANASVRKTLSGAAIFSAVFGRTVGEASRNVLTPERLPTLGGGVRDIELVPWDLAQIPHVDRSVELAAILEQQLRGRVPLAARPVGGAPLRILESANMPAVLVELGYLTNPEQEKQLAGNEFQTVFAQAAFDAVVRFREALEAGRKPPARTGAR